MIPKDGVFYPILTQIMDSFSCSPLNSAFLFISFGRGWHAKLHEVVLLAHINDANGLTDMCMTSYTTNAQPSRDSLGKETRVG